MANERPLDEAALGRLREDLAAGKRPSLVLLSGGAGLAAGSRAQLLRIDDPPQDAEFLHVKVGNDELPFAPEELALPGRRTRSTREAPEPPPSAAPPTPIAPPPEPILEPVRPDRRTRSARVTQPPPPPAEPEVTEPNPDTSASEPSVVPGDVSADGNVRRRPRKASRPGAPPKITLTLRFADFTWTVESLVAGRRDKPAPVPLASIRAFADQLEDQSLRRQLDATVEACRTEAKRKADALRAELARLETELAALDD